VSDDFFCSAPMPIQESQINPFDVGQPPGHAALRRHGFLIQKIAGLKRRRMIFVCVSILDPDLHASRYGQSCFDLQFWNLAKPSSLNLHRASQLVNSEKRRAIEGLL